MIVSNVTGGEDRVDGRVESEGRRSEDRPTVGNSSSAQESEPENDDFKKAHVDNENIKNKGHDPAEIQNLLLEKSCVFQSKLKMARMKMKF